MSIKTITYIEVMAKIGENSRSLLQVDTAIQEMMSAIRVVKGMISKEFQEIRLKQGDRVRRRRSAKESLHK